MGNVYATHGFSLLVDVCTLYKKRKKEGKNLNQQCNKSTAVGRDLFPSAKMCVKSAGSVFLKDDTDTAGLTALNLPQDRRGKEGRGGEMRRNATWRRRAGARQ